MSIGTPRSKNRHRKHDSAAGTPSERAPARPAPYFAWQHLRCRAAAAVLLVPGLPVMGALVLVIKLLSRGPAIYRQTRVGLNGRTFVMYKFRSMRLDAEAATGAVWTTENDPRITRLGWFLRKLHLDEFPQLFNVVRGEMALIGPRPERPEFTHKLARELPGYLGRLAVRPGITGLAQINLPPDTDLESVRRKLVLDLEYMEHASLSMDLRILAATFLRLFHIRTALLLWALRLRRKPDEASGQGAVGSGQEGVRSDEMPLARPVESHAGNLEGQLVAAELLAAELLAADEVAVEAGEDEDVSARWLVAGQKNARAGTNGHARHGNGKAHRANGHDTNGHANRPHGNGHAGHGSSRDLFPHRPK